MRCDYFEAGTCTSCTLMGTDHHRQVADKQADAQSLLSPFAGEGLRWESPFIGAESGFRNKAKMVVGGTRRRPTLGILDSEGHGVDLRRCGVISPGMQAALRVLSMLVSIARLTPYDVRADLGELKYVLVTESPAGDLQLRFVLRSTDQLPSLRAHLPGTIAKLQEGRPGIAVLASANIQPEHKAVIEGPTEIPLTADQSLRMTVNGMDLHLRPRSFFQTNTEVAAALYRAGRDWVDALAPARVWDLYCGVGGFALHLAREDREVTGVEVSAEAIDSAALTTRELGLPGTRWIAADATRWAGEQPVSDRPDLVVVNPPRRGLGAELSSWLEDSGIDTVLYSSCNARSLAKDLERMPSLRPVRARVFDMFPQTRHYEVLTLLTRG
ncbi:23S rRNA (uracil(747)-C(5))-methyltransferase RlmC [Brevibacterium litoralis]|uniref:23S rRNA (uracil(747)-C(5))-methyltransferase RlmC n=1 Tax=Brevibacterium litoralis TaxID=3138935 RepID=UPI0032EAB3E6